MGKVQTSQKRESSSRNIRANKKRKLTANLENYSPRNELLDRKFVLEAVADALLDGDAKAVREILAAHLEQVEKESFYKKAGVSRRALFNLMKPEANPTLNSLAKICKALAKVA